MILAMLPHLSDHAAATVGCSRRLVSGHDRWTSIPSCWRVSSSPSRSTFHIIFPSFTIGLSAFIATLLVRWIVTGREHLHRLARFWTKIFAVSFGMGVVSGIVLSYQFGTNWSRFSVVVGNVIAPADRLRGADRLLPRSDLSRRHAVRLEARAALAARALAAVAVAVGTAISAFWILSANSWMQTPAGHEMRDGIAYPVDWFAVIFNPSFPYRLAHMLTAAYLTTSLVVLGGGRALPARRPPHRRRPHHAAHGDRHAGDARHRCSSSSATSTGSTRSSTSR